MDNLDVLAIAREVFASEITELQNVSRNLDDNFVRAVDYISRANKIVCSGVGKSGIIAKKIAATFSSFGVSAMFLHPVEALHGDIGAVQKGDVAILLSKSGNTEELIRLVPYLKISSAYIISITGNLNSYLARHSDAVLNGQVSREACPFNLAPTSSTTAALLLGDALAVATMKMKGVTIEDFSRLHPLGQIGRSVTLRVKDVMHTGDALPIIQIHSTFKEALIEMSRKPLGCVCICDDQHNLLGIITDGDVRRLLNRFDNLKDIVVSEVMTRNPIVIDENSLLLNALALMENRQSQINVLPVVENGKLLGLIRLHDIVRSGQ
jgi:arabinose-5-phosphate isomerase